MIKSFFVGLLTILLVLTGCASLGKAGQGKSGTATVSTLGFGGEITVTVTTENGKIVIVEATGPYETQGVGSLALLSVPAQMVARNSLDVDTLTGASTTSNAIMEAAKAAVALINQ